VTRPAPYNVGMRRGLYILANALAGLVLVLLVIDPTRDMTPIVALLAAAVVCAAVPSFLRRPPGGVTRNDVRGR
jgi:hypothetical protein